MRSFRVSWSLLLGLSVFVASGCSESSNSDTASPAVEHAHTGNDHGPESLKDAVAELTSTRDAIRDAFAKNDQDAAHDPLHEVGHVLEAIPELAKKEKVSVKDQNAIEKAVNDLMDAFGRVDKTMHGQEGSTYSEESATIDAAVEALSQACGLSSPKVESPAEVTPAGDAPATETPATETPASVESTPAPAADADASTDEKKPD